MSSETTGAFSINRAESSFQTIGGVTTFTGTCSGPRIRGGADTIGTTPALTAFWTLQLIYVCFTKSHENVPTQLTSLTVWICFQLLSAYFLQPRTACSWANASAPSLCILPASSCTHQLWWSPSRLARRHPRGVELVERVELWKELVWEWLLLTSRHCTLLTLSRLLFLRSSWIQQPRTPDQLASPRRNYSRAKTLIPFWHRKSNRCNYPRY